MARVAFPQVIQSPASGSAIAGAIATITQHVPGATPGTGLPATIYLAETGSPQVASDQIQSDASGRFTQGAGAGFAQYWLPQGTYDITISGPSLTAYVITREFASAGQSDEVAHAGELIFGAWVIAPSGCLVANGAAVSRSTYAGLFKAITLPVVATVSGFGTLFTSPALPSGLETGMPISGPGVPGGTTILSVNYGTNTFATNNNCSLGTNIQFYVCPWGVGDGSTTFNAPNLQGRFPLGHVPGLNQTGNPMGSVGGGLDHTHQITDVPQHHHTLSNAGGAQVAMTNISTVGIMNVGQPSAAGTFSDTATSTDSSYASSAASGLTGVALYGKTDDFSGTGINPAATLAANPAYMTGMWVVRTGLQ